MPPPRPRPRHRAPLYGLMLAGVVSQAGNAVTLLAIPWYVYTTTGDGARTGLAAAAGIAAHVLGSFFGGTLADRFDRRDVSAAADLASGVMVLGIPLLQHAGALSFGLLVALVFLGALLDAPGGAARAALVPDLARRAGMSLERANGLVNGASSLAEVLGPALAGLLLVSVAAPTALLVDGASFFVSLALTLALVPRGLGREDGLGEGGVVGTGLREGLRFLARPGAPRLITLANLATNFVGAPLFTVVMVAYLAGDGSSGGLSLGAVVAVGGAGMTLGALAFGRWGAALSRRALFLVGFAAFGAQYWILALSPPVGVVLAVFLVRGLLTGAYNPVCDTVLQERVPRRLLGTVYGAAGAVAILGEPVGLVAGGFVTERYGVRVAIVASAVAYAAATAALAAAPALRGFAPPKAARPGAATAEIADGGDAAA